MNSLLTPEEVLTRLGGVADAGTLLRVVAKAQVRRALREGRVVRDARGRYSLPGAAAGLRAAHRLTAAASHLTAAMLHGWEVTQAELVRLAGRMPALHRPACLRVAFAANGRAANPFEWHGSRSALRADCRRYNGLALAGWLVLRFAWEDVMFRPEYVRQCFIAAGQRPPVGHATVAVPRDIAA